MKRYLVNSSWMVGDNLASAIVGMAVMAVVARVLGPTAFGSYAYAFSLATLFGMFGHLGLDGLLTRELVDRPDEQPATLGTVFGVKLAGFFAGALAMIGFGLLVPAHGAAERWLFVAAALFVLAGAPANIIVTWFRARTDARPAALSGLAGTLGGGGVKLALLAAGAGIVAMGFAQAAAGALTTILALAFYRHHARALGRWRFDPARARRLLGESWLLFAGSLLAALYMNIDIAMVRLLAGAEAAGRYAVPARCIQIAQIVAIAVSTSVFPRLIAARAVDPDAMMRLLRLACCALVLLAYAAIAGVALVGEPLLVLIFGPAYAGSGLLLLLLSLSLPLAFCRYLITRWIILERQGRYLVASEAFGAAANIALNLVLIPRFGGAGAAVATLVAYFAASLLSLALYAPTRPLFAIVAGALVNPLTPLLRHFAPPGPARIPDRP